jgi:ABC-type polysaccharide/polyol phosphate transport system ATPase subunit
MNTVSIQLEHVNVSYWIPSNGIFSFKDFAIKSFRTKPFTYKQVLHDISATICRGDCVGIVGRNGSGKTTLLRVLSGILQPGSGKVTINGHIAPMLAIGAGLEMELSGTENIYLLGMLMGFKKKEIHALLEDIVAFSELSEADMAMEVKRYSTGMMSRLAFSISLAKNPEILIVDEALVVGDMGFQEKCQGRIRELKSAGSTIVYVSHSPAELKSVCNKGIYIDQGRIIHSGTMEEVAEKYLTAFHPAEE